MYNKYELSFPPLTPTIQLYFLPNPSALIFLKFLVKYQKIYHLKDILSPFHYEYDKIDKLDFHLEKGN